MSRRIFRNILSLALVFSVPLMVGCSGGGGSSPETPVDPNATPCGPTQAMAGKSAVWIYYQCDQADTIVVTNETLDSRTGVALGDKPVKRGMLSVRYRGLDNYRFGGVETFGVFFEAGGRAHNWKVNWQWFAFALGAGVIQNELVIQRFDGTCDPKPFCESHSSTLDLQFFKDTDIYQWDCWWNTDVNKVSCTVVNTTGDPNQITLENKPMGPYNQLRYIGVGKSAYYEHTYPGFDGIVSDFKVTIFN
ncbi:MAG: hypothetical protein OEZ55_03585 [Nitrospinota bacterium]|nr:hypothetical protein [Nitrospinota bacterium]